MLTRIGAYILSIVLSFVAGFIVSNIFYHKGIKEDRQKLINAVIYEINVNTHDPYYSEYTDTARYAQAGRPFDYLQNSALDQLYLNLSLFGEIDSSLFKQLESHLMTLKLNIAKFNEVISYRNNFLLVSPGNVKKFNPTVFEFYHKYIKEPMFNLEEFLTENYKDLRE